MPRVLGLLLALLLTLAAVVGIGFIVVPPVAQQTQELLQALPGLLGHWDAELNALAAQSSVAQELLGPFKTGESYFGALIQQVAGYLRQGIPYLFSGMGFVIDLLSVFAMGIYLAARPAVYRDGLIALVPPSQRAEARDILQELGHTLRSWIVGQLVGMSILGLLTWIGLVALGVPFALSFGVFTGVAAIVPFFGSLLSTVVPALFVLGQGGLAKAMLVVLLGVGVHLFEANIVSPMIMERQIHLPPVLTLLSVLIMAHLLGIVGLLVAVPVVAVAVVLTRRVYVEGVLGGRDLGGAPVSTAPARSVDDQPAGGVQAAAPG
jgi:predicted PurR-regulated permease PerM